jgi:hypothetical protein
MKYLVWLSVALLVVLHQDYWQWEQDALVWGFLPYALAYHAGISLAAAGLWVAAMRWCWPDDVDQVVDESQEDAA